MTDELTDEQLDDFQASVSNGFPLSIHSTAALVGALRSEREDLQIANERGDAWRERVKEDTLRIEKLREKNDRQAYRLSQYQSEVETTRHNLTGCVAELERERTKNLAAIVALRGTVEPMKDLLRHLTVAPEKAIPYPTYKLVWDAGRDALSAVERVLAAGCSLYTGGNEMICVAVVEESLGRPKESGRATGTGGNEPSATAAQSSGSFQ